MSRINSKPMKKTLMLNERSLTQHNVDSYRAVVKYLLIFISSLRWMSKIWVSNISSLRTLAWSEVILYEWKNEIIVQEIEHFTIHRFFDYECGIMTSTAFNSWTNLLLLDVWIFKLLKIRPEKQTYRHY